MEQLTGAGDLHATLHRRAQFFLAIAEQTTPGPREPEQVARLAEVDPEHANLLATLDWAGTSGTPDLELRLAGALGRFWWVRGYAALGRSRREAALQRTGDGPGEARARALLWCALLALWEGDDRCAQSVLEEAVELGRSLGDVRRTAWPLIVLAYVAMVALRVSLLRSSVAALAPGRRAADRHRRHHHLGRPCHWRSRCRHLRGP